MDFFGRLFSSVAPWLFAVLIVVVGLSIVGKAPTRGIGHQREALSLHTLIVKISGILAFVCILGGILALLVGGSAETSIDLFGAKLTTTHVGVAFVGIGLLVGYFTVKLVLKNQRDLANIPDSKPNDSH